MAGRLTIAAATVASLLASAGAALAGAGGAGATFPVEFDLSGATCSQLAPDQVIHFSGTASEFVSPGGTFHSVVTGTGTDGNGGFWRFNYADNGGRAAADGSFQISDHFIAVGTTALKLHSHFVIVFSSDGDPLRIKQLTGDPVSCDPI